MIEIVNNIIMPKLFRLTNYINLKCLENKTENKKNKTFRVCNMKCDKELTNPVQKTTVDTLLAQMNNETLANIIDRYQSVIKNL